MAASVHVVKHDEVDWGQKSKNDDFTQFRMSDLKVINRPRWLIPNLLMQQQIGVIYGPPGSFKSFIVLDLGLRLAHGMEWQGRPLTRSNIVYAAGEGFPMFLHRLEAWFKFHDQPEDDDGLAVIPGAFPLNDHAKLERFIARVKQQNPAPADVDLVIFDTLSTFTAGQDESDSGVMTSTIEAAKYVGQELKCAVLIVHHPGKDVSRGSRGHSSLLGNIDMEGAVVRDGMTCSLRVTKQKDAEDAQVFHYTAHKMMLGVLEDDSADEATSLALQPSAVRTAAEQAAPAARVPRELTDRISIAGVMKFDVPVSRKNLADMVKETFGCGRTIAYERIKAALSPDWQRVRRFDDVVVELRSLEPTKGNAAMVEMRPSTASSGLGSTGEK